MILRRFKKMLRKNQFFTIRKNIYNISNYTEISISLLIRNKRSFSSEKKYIYHLGRGDNLVSPVHFGFKSSATQLAITCSKLTAESLEHAVKYVQS